MASVEIPAISFVLAIFLSYLALGGASNLAGQGKASESVVVVGKVFCDPCLEHWLSHNGYVISDVSIAVKCGLNRKTMTLSILGETDENGEFRVELPSTIFQSADQIVNNCWVSPRKSPYESCRIPSKSAPSKLTLQSDSSGVLTYSAGSISYRHENLPPSCDREAFLKMNMRGRAMAENVDESSKASQQIPTIPSLPKFPPATLPNVPPLPHFSNPPLPTIPTLPKIPPLPKIAPLPTIPAFPKIAPLPTVPPLPKIPTLTPPLSFPPFPKPTIPGSPPFPQIPNFQFPPLPFLTPPPPSH